QSPNPRLSSDKRDNPYNSLEPSQTEQRNFSDEQDISHNLQEPSPTDSRPPDNSKHDSHVDNNPQPLIEYRTQHEHAPKELSIMDRFASARGFKWDENHKRFTHLSDGKWIGKTNGNIFHWELHDPEGNLICYYWPENHCLEKKPLELKAEVWKFIKMKKIPVSLILSDTNGKPVEVLGEYLMELVDSGKIKVHSASIRLVYEKPETDA
ncbi:MAG TPA: hypothetical protein PLB62_07475, partial [Candidatus Sumerlaeota bacterium]|nr:hypothetical protein [Candidatus Sumerlaeota bacterium]